MQDILKQSNIMHGVTVVEKMNEVGAFMRAAGLGFWWRTSMGYAKRGSG